MTWVYYPSNKTYRVTEGRYTTAIILNLASELSRSAPRVQFRNSLLMQLGFISPLLPAAASCWQRRHRIVCRVSQRKFPVLDSFPGLCQVSLVDCFREAFLLYQVGDNDNAIIRPVWYAIYRAVRSLSVQNLLLDNQVKTRMKPLLRSFSRSLPMLSASSRTNHDHTVSLPDYYRETKREVYGPHFSTEIQFMVCSCGFLGGLVFTLADDGYSLRWSWRSFQE